GRTSKWSHATNRSKSGARNTFASWKLSAFADSTKSERRGSEPLNGQMRRWTRRSGDTSRCACFAHSGTSSERSEGEHGTYQTNRGSGGIRGSEGGRGRVRIHG